MKTHMQLSSGALFDLLDPDPEHINIAEVASVLSVTPRWCGRARFPHGEPWTVAQHCILTADIVAALEPENAPAHLWALLHDAHEAFTGDITTPMQHAAEAVNRLHSIQGGIDQAIRDALGINWRDVAGRTLAIVKGADLIAMATEHRKFLPPSDWTKRLPPPFCGYHFLPEAPQHQALRWRWRLAAALERYKQQKAALAC